MEAVVLCGMQGSGKTTLYRDRFLNTHEHVSLDVVRTRAREAELLQACLDEGRSFVVDNTNPTPADRRRYVEPARAAGFKVIGYLVEADAGEAFARAGIPPGAGGRDRTGAPAADAGGGVRRAVARHRPRRRRLADRAAADDAAALLANGDRADGVVDRRQRVVGQLHTGRGGVLVHLLGPRLAPMIAEATFDWRRIQASASWDIVRPASSAIGRRRWTASRMSSSSHSLMKRFISLDVARESSGGGSPGQVLAGQDALGERRPHDLRDAVALAQRDHLGLRAAPQHRVLRLAGTTKAIRLDSPGIESSAAWILSGGHSLKPM